MSIKTFERDRGRAQVTLELTISIFLALILLVATARIFVWFSSRIVQRHSDYERTAVQAGSVEVGSGEPVIINETNYPKLDIFENWSKGK